MPELRNVRPRDAIRAFERAGGTSKQGRGDHVNIKMPNGRIVTVVDTREPMKIAILMQGIHKAGLTVAEFVEFLNG